MPKVPQVDAKAIFERATGHKVKPHTVIRVCGPNPLTDIDNTKTMSGVRKPSNFGMRPPRTQYRDF